MLILFFTIIFIAELIVTVWIISGIRRLNCQVCALNTKVCEFKPQIVQNMNSVRKNINLIFSALGCFSSFVCKKQTECKHLITKNIFTTILSYILKINSRKILTILNIALTLKKFIK